MTDKVEKPDTDWKAQLTPEQYAVCRCSATEAPFTGKWYRHKEKGTYVCVACGEKLFASDTKYESGSGWPSFHSPIDKANVGQPSTASRIFSSLSPAGFTTTAIISTSRSKVFGA
jgi:peptide-methionine (R)-S-oxide reductase